MGYLGFQRHLKKGNSSQSQPTSNCCLHWKTAERAFFHQSKNKHSASLCRTLGPVNNVAHCQKIFCPGAPSKAGSFLHMFPLPRKVEKNPICCSSESLRNLSFFRMKLSRSEHCVLYASFPDYNTHVDQSQKV